MKNNYYFSIKREEDGYSAFVPAFNITVVDDNLNDLAKGVDESIDVAISVYNKNHKKIPKSDGDFTPSGKLSLRLPRSLHKKLYYSAKDQGISINQLIISKVAV